MSCSERRSRKMSASSIRSTAFHVDAISKMRLRRMSSVELSVPRSPDETIYSGRLQNSATVSAVSVLPTPGGPCST